MPDTLLGGIVINEILADPNGAINFDTDGSGTAEATDEFIELYNMSGSAIDISGLELWDAGAGNWFTFPPGTVLQPGAHAMDMTGVSAGGSLPTGGPDDLFFDGGRGASLINNGGDNVTVYDPTNDSYIQAVFNGDSPDDPTLGASGYSGFSATATQSGSGENFGFDTDGESLQRYFDGSDVFVSDTPTPGTANVCFVGGTNIQTPGGPRRVEDLRPGDMVITGDNGPKPVAWVYSFGWSPTDMMKHQNLAPIRICHGALGPDLPRRDLYLSQQHRVLVQSRIAQRMFGHDEVLVAAKSLLPLPGVVMSFPANEIRYFHVMLESHEILMAEGLRTESLFLGGEAVKSISPAALEELRELVDHCTDETRALMEQPVRALASSKRARVLIERHLKNEQPVRNVA